MNASSATTATTATTTTTSFLTPVVLCILVTETAERFAYFGFRAVLVLYFTYSLEYPETTAIALFAYTTCFAYLSPLLGALLADGHLGRYHTILIFGCVYTVGLIILTAGAYLDGSPEQLANMRILTFAGLFLVCLGTGGIKPCVAAFGCDQVVTQGTQQQQQHNDGTSDQSSGLMDETDGTLPQESIRGKDNDRVRHFFASFYFCINVGAVTSIFLIPIIRAHYGFGAAFLTPTVFIMLAMLAFLSKSKEYVHHVPETSLVTTFRLCGWILRKRIANIPLISRHFPCIRPAQSPLSSSSAQVDETTTTTTSMTSGSERDSDSYSNGLFEKTTVDVDTIRNQQLSDATQALHVMPIMAMLPMFWMLYDQQGSVWTLQATRMALHGLQPEQMNVVNPLLIMAFIPLFERIIYPALERVGWNISHLRRMGWGMLLAAVSFLVSGLLETIIQSREATGTPQVHVLWQLPQITIITVAEIFLSVTGLEFAYATSPDRLKAFLMALYLLTTAIGDFFGGLLYSSVFQNLNRSVVMYVCALLMLGNLGLFFFVARWWERSEASNHKRRRLVMMAGAPQRLSSGDELDYESLSRTTSFKGVELQRQKGAVMT